MQCSVASLLQQRCSDVVSIANSFRIGTLPRNRLLRTFIKERHQDKKLFAENQNTAPNFKPQFQHKIFQ